MNKLTHIQPNDNISPFDSIKRFDELGIEFWYARELQELMGYTNWRKFNTAIEQAKENLELNGDIVSNHFDLKVKKSKGRNAKDYKLTRYAAYMTALCCDGRKQEVAQAKKYFAIKTREAEVVIPQQVQPQQPRLNPKELVETAKGIEDINNATLQELLRNELIDYLSVDQGNKALPSQKKEYTIAKVRAKELGYSTTDIKNGSGLGRFVAKNITEAFTERIGKYNVKHYLVTDELDTAIHTYFGMKKALS